MSDIQQKIDEILRKRKTNVEKLLEQEKAISDLKTSISGFRFKFEKPRALIISWKITFNMLKIE